MNEKTLNESIKWLSKNSEIKKIINKYPVPEFSPDDNYFEALSKTIIHQQLNGKVAKLIHARYLNLFKNKIPNPTEYLKIKKTDLRDTGLSFQKINYIHNLSIFFVERGNKIEFNSVSNEEIYKELITIKGIGKWTIDIFMIFTLCKMDILPLSDLGIKKGFKKLYNLNELPSENFMKKKSLKWSPYRTIVSYYLWKLSDDNSKV